MLEDIPRPLGELDDELDMLERNYRGLIQQFRLECLGRMLDTSPPMAVRDSQCGFCGDRLSIALDNGAVIKMKLLQPCRERFAALSSLRWRDGIGWVLCGRSTGGEAITCYGWQASITGLRAVAR